MLPKRADIKKFYREDSSESPMEAELKYQLLRRGIRAEQQYKIGSFFVDFALPRFKIAIEYDGADYHLDKDKDEARDSYIRSQGWNVIRIALKKHLRSIKVNGVEPYLNSIGEEHGVRMDEEHYIWDVLARHIKDLMLENGDYKAEYSSEIKKVGGFSAVGADLMGAYKRIAEK